MQKKFIVVHKDVPEDFLKDKDDYILVSNRDVQNASKHTLLKTNKELDDRMWSELSCFDTILENTSDDDYISINHYRRILNHEDNKVCLPVPYNQPGSNIIMYSKYHNGHDLLTCGDIIKDIFPAMYQSYIDTINSPTIFTYNMMNVPKPIFKDSWNFVKTILLNFIKIIKVKSYDDMVEHINKTPWNYLKGEGQNKTIEYQSRLVSFLSERLFTVYFNHLVKTDWGKTNKIICVPVTLLEENQKI